MSVSPVLYNIVSLTLIAVFDHWKHHTSHISEPQQSGHFSDPLDFIHNKLPKQIKTIKGQLESGVKMESAALKVQDELLMHKLHIKPEDAKVAADIWEKLSDSLSASKTGQGTHSPFWSKLVPHLHSHAARSN